MEILICGTGVMGKGIAQTFASKGFKVYLFNPNLERSEYSKSEIETRLNKQVNKNKMSLEHKNRILKNIVCSNKIEDSKNVDLVIETVSENNQAKKKILSEIDEKINENAIIATNTSSLSITELSRTISRPEKFIGMHFFNPAPVMELVEIISSIFTSEDTKEYIYELSNKLGKTGVYVEENPGFIVNRILIPMINEAIATLAENTATINDIDKAMILGANHPIGPLKLADLIGLDVCLNILDTLYLETGNPKYSAHPLLRKMVRGNILGIKSKEGFYSY